MSAAGGALAIRRSHADAVVAGYALRATALAAAVALVTAAPYVYGYASAPADRQFMGIVLNVPDTAQYLSWARESARAVFIENKLTPEYGPPVYFNLFWLMVGRLAVLLNIGGAEATQLVRPLAGAAYVLAIAWFVGLVERAGIRRWTAVLVAVLGGGLGWLLVVEKYLARTAGVAFPLDLYVTEPNTFLTVMAFPHQAMAGGLLVLILGLAALALERDALRPALGAGVLGLLLGVQHGYDLLIVYAVVGAVAVQLMWQRRGGRWVRPAILGAAVCAPSLPAALYLAYITRESAIWQGALAQYGDAGVFTPSPLHLLVLLGAPLILVALGIPVAVRQAVRHGLLRTLAHASPRERFLWTWLVVGFFLLYIPTNFQIKMLVAWQVPLAILATRVLFSAAVWVAGRAGWRETRGARTVFACVFVAAVLPANLYLFAWRFADLGRHDAPYYLARDDVAAMHWLAAHAAPSDVVLSSLTTGQYVPSLTGTHAFVAHWAMTLNYPAKRRMVGQFFAPATSDASRQRLTEAYGIRYVVVGEHERALGAFDPSASLLFTRVYASPGTDIYRVGGPGV